MADFSTMNTAAYEAANPTDKVRIYREITSRAQMDPEFRKTVNMDEYAKGIKNFKRHLAKEPKGSGLNIAILGYAVELMGKWDPFDTVKGLPGSEECAVYASQELARRGHNVTVYLSPPDGSIWRSPFSNPRWLPVDLWDAKDNSATYDLVFMWRRYDPDAGRKRGKLVFFWPHDSPPVLQPGQKFNIFPKFDGICILSEHHRSQFKDWPGFDKIPYIVSGNGIIPEQFSEPMSATNPYSIGYFSNYARGLIVLMVIWPEIRKEFPEATLSICYGRETWNTMSPQALQFVINKIGEYKNMGVTEHGKVGHLELANIMQHTSVWAYPCLVLGETFCITATKCQAAGCIPVTTRIAALNETIHPDAPQMSLITNDNDIPKYRDLLLATLRRIRDSDPEQLKKERQKYIDFAHKFSWSACIDKWLQLYDQVTRSA